jgi:hypothetical protein
MSIRIEHSLAKRSLMKALANCRRYVCSSCRIVLTDEAMHVIPIEDQAHMHRIVYRYREKQLSRTVFHYEDGPGRQVFAGNDSVKIDEWKPAFHGKAQAPVVRMVAIGPAVAIAQEALWSKGIVVRTLRRRCDRQRCIAKRARFEDALGSNERDAFTVQCKALRKNRPLQNVPVNSYLLA